MMLEGNTVQTIEELEGIVLPKMAEKSTRTPQFKAAANARQTIWNRLQEENHEICRAFASFEKWMAAPTKEAANVRTTQTAAFDRIRELKLVEKVDKLTDAHLGNLLPQEHAELAWWIARHAADSKRSRDNKKKQGGKASGRSRSAGDL